MTMVNSPLTPQPGPALPPPAATGGRRWTAGRITVLTVGIFLLLGAIGLAVSGALVKGIDNEWRQDGYITSEEVPLSTSGHAVATERIDIEDVNPFLTEPDGLLGKVRLRATNSSGTAIFIGIARAEDAASYLDGVEHATLTEIADPATAYTQHAGGAPTLTPGASTIWAFQAEGTGTQSVRWPLSDGTWTVVVMNADGSPGIDVRVDVGATVPLQERLGSWLLVAAIPVGVIGGALVVGAVLRARREVS